MAAKMAPAGIPGGPPTSVQPVNGNGGGSSYVPIYTWCSLAQKRMSVMNFLYPFQIYCMYLLFPSSAFLCVPFSSDYNSRKRPHDEGGTGGTCTFGYTKSDMCALVHTFQIPTTHTHTHTLDDGPQVKKPSIEDPQAVAQAAIAKFVDKYAYLSKYHCMWIL